MQLIAETLFSGDDVPADALNVRTCLWILVITEMPSTHGSCAVLGNCPSGRTFTGGTGLG